MLSLDPQRTKWSKRDVFLVLNREAHSICPPLPLAAFELLAHFSKYAACKILHLRSVLKG